MQIFDDVDLDLNRRLRVQSDGRPIVLNEDSELARDLTCWMPCLEGREANDYAPIAPEEKLGPKINGNGVFTQTGTWYYNDGRTGRDRMGGVLANSLSSFWNRAGNGLPQSWAVWMASRSTTDWKTAWGRAWYVAGGFLFNHSIYVRDGTVRIQVNNHADSKNINFGDSTDGRPLLCGWSVDETGLVHGFCNGDYREAAGGPLINYGSHNETIDIGLGVREGYGDRVFSGWLWDAATWFRVLTPEDWRALWEPPTRYDLYWIPKIQIVLPPSAAPPGPIEGAITLGASHGLTEAAQGDYAAAVGLPVDLTLTSLASKIAEGGISLPVGLTLTVAGEVETPGVIEGAISLGVALGHEAALVAQYEVALALAAEHGTAMTAQQVLHTVAQLGAGFGLTTAGGQEIQAAVNLAVSQALATEFDTEIYADVTLSASLGAAAAAQADLGAEAQLAQVLGLQAVTEALFQAGIDLDAVQSLTMVGSVISVGLKTPDGRTLNIRLSSRTYDVQ